ncbi:exported hypothetical protein [Cupriavidus taiwanensis]|nr:exported hypothetical protein [Cupriavidus taiwanensis]SOZ31246.1 exported hypothetical protein [Cupriavidus taiwanensis]SOZ47323.1 exported hypothetical protein [Cupriavidus taiwanensis]
MNFSFRDEWSARRWVPYIRRQPVKTLIETLVTMSVMAPSAFAQGDAYPNRPIKLVVPFTAESASDTAARIVAEEVRHSLGTIVVDNRPGANGIIGSSYVAKSPARWIHAVADQ